MLNDCMNSHTQFCMHILQMRPIRQARLMHMLGAPGSPAYAWSTREQERSARTSARSALTILKRGTNGGPMQLRGGPIGDLQFPNVGEGEAARCYCGARLRASSKMSHQGARTSPQGARISPHGAQIVPRKCYRPSLAVILHPGEQSVRPEGQSVRPEVQSVRFGVFAPGQRVCHCAPPP